MHALRRALSAGAAASARRFTASGVARADEAAAAAATKAFLEKFAARAPSTMAAPNFPTDYLPKAAAAAATGTPDKVTLNFYLPHTIEFQGEKVDQVSIPATTGEFGVLPGHVPTVAQLKPGVLAVHLETDKNVKKYFVSSGFAFVHADSSTDVCAVEAVPLDQLDHDAVKQGLADYQAKLMNAKDDYEKAAAQVGIEVCSAMNSALGG